MTHFWQTIFGNLTTVALVMTLWAQAQPWLEARLRLSREMLFGLAMGTGAVLSMMMNAPLQPGVFFDLRHAMIAMAGLFGGGVSVIIAALMAIGFRLSMGGMGMAFGITGILSAALVSTAVRTLVGGRTPRRRDVFTLAAAVTGVSFLIAISRFSPVEEVDFLKLGLPLTTLNFASVSVCGLIMVAIRDYAIDRDLARFALAQSPSAYYIKDAEGHFRILNKAAATLFGFPAVGDLRGLRDQDLTASERAQSYAEEDRAIVRAGDAVIDKQEMVVTANGTKWYSTSKIAVRTEKGEVMGIAGVTHDVTARKQMEQELASSRMHLDYAMREMSDGLALFSPTGHLMFCNDQYRALFPLTADVRVPGNHIQQILTAVVDSGEQLNIPQDGKQAWIEQVSLSLFVDNDQEIRTHQGRWLQIRTRRTNDGSALVVVTDMTVMKESEIALRTLTDQLRSLAETDGLTGLINRRVFDVRLDAAVEAANAQHPLSLLMIDVDLFKAFNDRYGHTAGDECLKAVADCLRALGTRATDTVARFGGEEFVVILPDTDASGAFAVGERLRQKLESRGIAHEGSPSGRVTASIGVATTVQPRNSARLVQMADMALYSSKTAGRNRTSAA